MKNKQYHKLLSFCRERASEDYFGIWCILRYVKEYYPNKDSREWRELVMEIVEDLLELYDARVGSWTDQGMVLWDVSTEEALERIDREWGELGRDPDIAEIADIAIL